jgi:hypothetical protein
MKAVSQNPTRTARLTKLFGTIALGGTLASQLMACSPQTIATSSFASSLELDRETHAFNRAFKPGTQAAKDESEKMAKLAEKLVRSNTMHIAHKVAFQALELHQSNTRAQFILKMTAPLMELKGIYSRVLPIVSVRPEKRREYKNYLKQIREWNAGNPDLVNFLIEGQPDLHRESQVQDVIEKYVERTDELRDWLKENRKQDFSYTYYIPGEIELPACIATEKASGVWQLDNCNRGVTAKTVKLNMADFESIRQIAAGVQVYAAMATAYSVDGIMKASAALPSTDASEQTKYESFSKIKGLGQLRNTKFFVLAPKVVSDFVIGYRVAKKLHTELCPAGGFQDNSRPGMLFHGGICTDRTENGERLIATLDLLARGKIAPVSFQVADGAKIDVAMDTKTFIRQPPKDLRDLGPAKFNKCEQVEALADGTFAGLFSKGELNDILAHESKSNCP